MNKYWMIQVEGIDKTGKDLLCDYIGELSHYQYTPYARGIISLLSYNEKYMRGKDYDVSSTITNTWVFIYLYGDDEDIKIRSKLNNEEFRGLDKPYFEKYIKLLEDNKYIVRKYNVSKLTYYEIAKDIIKYMEDLNNGNIL